MKTNKNKIIDERQEKLSLKNTSVAFNVMTMILLVMLVVQSFFLRRDFAYIGPEFIAIVIGCVLKLILDIRQGVVYTQMNAKTKLTVALYVLSALVFSVLLGIRNYILYDFAFWKIIFVIIPMFAEMLILFTAAHFACLWLSKRRLKKLEKNLDRDEDDE